MTFDIASFAQTQFTEVPSDKFQGIPPNEYLAQITGDEKTLEMKTGTIANGENAGKPWALLNIRMSVADPTGALKATHGDKPGITYGIMLDLAAGSTVDQPIPDWGVNKNVKLGKLLEVTGVRKPGWKFTDLYNKPLKIKVEDVVDRKDPTVSRSTVVAVTAANQ